MEFVWTVICSVTCLSYSSTVLGAEYTATSTLRVAWQAPTLLGRTARAVSHEEFQAYKKTQRLLLKADFVLRAALTKPGVAKLAGVRNERDPVRWLGDIIKVTFPDDAEIMSVSCTRKDPHEAKILTKAVVDSYMSEVVLAEAGSKRDRCSELDKIVAEKEQELRRKLETLNKLGTMLSDDAKAAKKPVPVDIQMLRLEVGTLQDVLHELCVERELLKIEVSAPPRVMLLEAAYEPLTSD
jgi:hypothetical protein